MSAWLSVPGPALLNVVVERDELIMPPHIGTSQVLGAALYSVKAMMASKGHRSMRLGPTSFCSHIF